MATYCMIWKKFHQKYLLVIINYPPEWILRQYISMSNFLIFGVFKCLLHKKSKMSFMPVFSDRSSYVKLVLISDTYCILIYAITLLLPFKKLVLVLMLSKAWRNSQSKAV